MNIITIYKLGSVEEIDELMARGDRWMEKLTAIDATDSKAVLNLISSELPVNCEFHFGPDETLEVFANRKFKVTIEEI